MRLPRTSSITSPVYFNHFVHFILYILAQRRKEGNKERKRRNSISTWLIRNRYIRFNVKVTNSSSTDVQIRYLWEDWRVARHWCRRTWHGRNRSHPNSSPWNEMNGNWFEFLARRRIKLWYNKIIRSYKILFFSTMSEPHLGISHKSWVRAYMRH